MFSFSYCGGSCQVFKQFSPYRRTGGDRNPSWFHRCVVVICLSFSFLIKTGSCSSVLCDLLVSLKVKHVCPWGTHQLGGEGFSGRCLPGTQPGLRCCCFSGFGLEPASPLVSPASDPALPHPASPRPCCRPRPRFCPQRTEGSRRDWPDT